MYFYRMDRLMFVGPKDLYIKYKGIPFLLVFSYIHIASVKLCGDPTWQCVSVRFSLLPFMYVDYFLLLYNSGCS